MADEVTEGKEIPLDQQIYELLVTKGQLPKNCRDFTVIAEFQKPLRVITEYLPEPLNQGQ